VVRRECAHGHRVCLQLRSGGHVTHGLHPHLRGETIPPVVTGMPPGTVWSHRNFFVPSWHDTLHRCLYRFDPSNSRSPSTHRKQAVLSTGVFAISRRGRNRLRLWPSHVATRASFHSASSPTHLTLIFVRELLLRRSRGHRPGDAPAPPRRWTVEPVSPREGGTPGQWSGPQRSPSPAALAARQRQGSGGLRAPPRGRHWQDANDGDGPPRLGVGCEDAEGEGDDDADSARPHGNPLKAVLCLPALCHCSEVSLLVHMFLCHDNAILAGFQALLPYACHQRYHSRIHLRV
jgi:hypothetical protein